MKIISYPVVLIASLLSGCVSLDDFKQMDASQRAEYVCNRDHAVEYHERKISTFENKIDDISAALDRGYRVHKSCETISFEVPDKIICKNIEKGNKTYQECYNRTKHSYEQVCSETPVPIAVELEKENLHKYEHLLEDSVEERDANFEYCYSDVRLMSAEQAYYRYKQ